MTKELQDKLYNDFPKLFRQKDLPKEESAMCWGIDCPDEWYDIIYKLCRTIQNYIDWNEQKQIEFTQVKEKFGFLRVYYNNSNQWIDGAIAMANAMLVK